MGKKLTTPEPKSPHGLQTGRFAFFLNPEALSCAYAQRGSAFRQR